MNNDGRIDLISAICYEDVLTVLTNDGTGGFVTACTPDTGPYPYTVAAADFDGDGKLELVCALGLTNAFALLTNNGNGIFLHSRDFAIGHSTGDNLTVADVDGDGKTDVIVVNWNENQIWVLKNTTAFPNPIDIPLLQISYQTNRVKVQWPSISPGWSLQRTTDPFMEHWTPAGNGVEEVIDDGATKSLTLPLGTGGQMFFRLLHP
ncbi:MAG: VCBS repeat-containing protein [Verrucomicrobiota bacterium]